LLTGKYSIFKKQGIKMPGGLPFQTRLAGVPELEAGGITKNLHNNIKNNITVGDLYAM